MGTLRTRTISLVLLLRTVLTHQVFPNKPGLSKSLRSSHFEVSPIKQSCSGYQLGTPGRTSCAGRQGPPGSLFSFLARVAAGGPQSACSGQFAAGRRAPELLAAAPHRGRSRSGSRGARGTGSWEVRGAASGRGRHPRGVARGGLHVKRAALGARELRPAWAPPRPRTGRAAP